MSSAAILQGSLRVKDIYGTFFGIPAFRSLTFLNKESSKIAEDDTFISFPYISFEESKA